MWVLNPVQPLIFLDQSQLVPQIIHMCKSITVKLTVIGGMIPFAPLFGAENSFELLQLTTILQLPRLDLHYYILIGIP